jgi:hypothetical protein
MYTYYTHTHARTHTHTFVYICHRRNTFRKPCMPSRIPSVASWHGRVRQQPMSAARMRAPVRAVTATVRGVQGGERGGGERGSPSCWQRKRSLSPRGLPHKIIRACGRWLKRYLLVDGTGAAQQVTTLPGYLCLRRAARRRGLGEVDGFVEVEGVGCRGGRWLGCRV